MTGVKAWAASVSVTFRDGRTAANVILKPDREAWANCSTYEDRAPILSLRVAGSMVTIYPPDDQAVTPGDVAAARALNDAAALYLAECLRLRREIPRDKSGESSAA